MAYIFDFDFSLLSFGKSARVKYSEAYTVPPKTVETLRKEKDIERGSPLAYGTSVGNEEVG